MTLALLEPKRARPARPNVPWPDYLADALRADWRTDEWNVDTATFVGLPANPMTAVGVCRTPACSTLVDGLSAARCSACRKSRVRWNSDAEFDAAVTPTRRQPREATCHVFRLDGLTPQVHNEIIYALQARDAEGIALRPSVVAGVCRLAVGANSVLDIPTDDANGLVSALIRAIQLEVRRLRMAHAGRDGTEGDVWECALVGLRSAPNRRYLATSGKLDFTVVRQAWLRRVVLEVTRAHRPSVAEARRMVQATEIASHALAARPHGAEPAQLGLADMSVVFEAFATARNRETGEPYSTSHRRALLGWWRRLLQYGRAGGLMDDVPGAFALLDDHALASDEQQEGELGQAIPEEWIAHLDAHQALLGQTKFANGQWSPEDYQLMYQTAYALMRDTGRRTNEIVALRRDPVEYQDSSPVLVYDNRKARRLGRRLPIDASTVELVRAWQARLDDLVTPPGCEGLLFPAPGARNRERRGHLSPNQFAKVFRTWVRVVPTPTGLSPEATQFAVENVDPYGLRHAYAQRHADNGTPVDVLRELMDHKDINTTMGYFQVSLKRKKEAVQLLSRFTTDRHGNPAPFTDAVAYQRSSVAVPYGTCTEPTNVKAGGKQCPIRYQCSGCGYFRHDPSYLEPLESHIAQLRADREIALAADVADWVIANLDEQIASFTQVAARMKATLGAMAPTERSELDEAAATLRKSREAAFVPLVALRRRDGQ